MAFIAELKQRRVFRVGLAYLVVAWITIQAASIALPAFDAPAWTLRVAILLFALGFPLALMLAWAVDVTPDGVRMAPGTAGNKRMAGIALVLVALALGWYYLGQPALRRSEATPVAVVPQRSIAVLPFVNMSGDPANDYFSDGLAETTLDMLAQVHDLKVIARTSSFAFKGKATDMRAIGRALGAANLLEGSVQEAGDTVRITVQLIRAGDGSHLWSRHFDRRMTDVFKIQDEVATAVVHALQIALPVPEQRRLLQKRTGNVDAYQEFLKGIALMPDRKVPEMRAAAQHFERAIALDPGYARAYVAAYDVYNLLSQYASITPDEGKRAVAYLQRGLQLAPELGEAHIAHAVELENQNRLVEAEAEYRRGLQLAPGYATGYQWYGEMLAGRFGRFDAALPLLDKAAELDPLSSVIRGTRLFLLAQSGRVDEALALSDRMIAEHPDIARTYDDRGALDEQRGDVVAALRDLRMQDTLDPDAVGYRAHRCHVMIDVNAMDDARRCVAILERRAPATNEVLWVRARLALADNDGIQALDIFGRTHPPTQRGRAAALVFMGQPDAALAVYRQLNPDLFAKASPTVYPAQAADAVMAGAALLQVGMRPQGEALLRGALAAIADRPYAAVVAGRGWLDFVAYAQLGERERAYAALREAVDHGFFLGIEELDHLPLVADLRSDPRYQAILAPARARAAAQVEAARKAGLL